MGVRLVTDSNRLAFKGQIAGAPWGRTGAASRSETPVTGNYLMELIYDGTTGTQGLSPLLLPTEAWIDGSGLYRIGVNFGPTFQNDGATVCTLYACQGPRDYSYNITAARVAELSSQWKQLVVLNPGDAFSPTPAVYSLFRFLFTASGSNTGCVRALSA